MKSYPVVPSTPQSPGRVSPAPRIFSTTIQGPSAGLSLDCLLRYLAGLSEDERAALKGKKAAIVCHDGGLLYPDYTTGELDTHEGMS